MNKKLIAIAVASTFGLAASAANAGEVAVGGQAHISVDWISAKNDAAPDAVKESNIALSSNSSRINFKGSEDLGNGTEVGFFFEWGVGLDGGQNDLSTRNRYAFIKGKNWGQVRLGKMDTPMKVLGRKMDLFYSTQLGENRMIVGQASGSTSTYAGGPGWDLRTDNTIAYITPGEKINGVIGYVTDHDLCPGEPGNRFDNNNCDAISALLNLNFGGFYAGIAYEIHNAKDYVPAGFEDSEQGVRVGISYTGSSAPWKVTGLAQFGKDVGFLSQDQNAYGVGFAWGKQTVFKAQYFVMDKLKDCETTGTCANEDDTGASNLSLGVDYKASKQTMFYVTGTFTSNDDEQVYGITGGHDDKANVQGSVGVGAGEDVQGLSLGMRYVF
jgi:predicted porin